MIERVRAESGDPVVRIGGRLLASRIDPRLEARAWADARGAFLKRVKTVVVLGLGAGYHVAELFGRTTAQILVIEPNADLAAAPACTPSVALDPNRVVIVQATSVAELRAADAVRAAVGASYVVLTHPASRALDPDLYRAFSEQLNGREWGSLNWVWSLRGGADLGPDSSLRDADQPLTIYDLAQSEVVQNADERKSLLIKALRELVK